MSKPSQVARMLRSCIELQIPYFLSGPVGAGKSQVVKQVCDELGMQFVDVRLSQMDPTDIKGFPSPDAANNIMRWLPADFLPPMLIKGKPNLSKGHVFMDEMNSAPQMVLASAYQFVLDRKVGSYTLPVNWTVGGAGNRAEDRSIVNKIPAALSDRFLHIDYEVDLEDWVAYAMKSGISAETVAFLRFRSNLLHSFDPTTNPRSFPTPRSWFAVDKIVRAKTAAADEYALIQGKVGAPAAAEFAAFMRVIADLPSIDEIKVAPDTTSVPTEPATLYALTTSLSMATDVKHFPRFLQYIERMDVEWQVVYIRDCLTRCNAVKLTKEYTKWTIAHSDVVL